MSIMAPHAARVKGCGKLFFVPRRPLSGASFRRLLFQGAVLRVVAEVDRDAGRAVKDAGAFVEVSLRVEDGSL